MLQIPFKRRIALTACRLIQAHRWWGSVDRWSGVVVLNYHRIGDPQSTDFDRGVFSASAETFESQVRYLKRDCDLIRSSDLPDVLRENGHRRAVLMTFDDGYRDNFDVAMPILKSHDASAVFFISTGLIDSGGPAWWDEVAWIVRKATAPLVRMSPWLDQPVALTDQDAASRSLLRPLKFLSPEDREQFLDELALESGAGRCPAEMSRSTWMTWDMVRAMHAAGMEIGAHTVTHPVLSYCTESVQRAEIGGSKARLEQELNAPVKLFSFPVGRPWSFTDQTRQIVRDAGFQWAFSFYSGITSCPSDPFDIRRIAVTPSVSMDELRAIVHMPRIFAR